jgi:transcriptional regulator of nitric oxide reductase
MASIKMQSAVHFEGSDCVASGIYRIIGRDDGQLVTLRDEDFRNARDNDFYDYPKFYFDPEDVSYQPS